MANKGIEYDANWGGVAGLTSEFHSEKTAPMSSAVENGIKIAISADTEYPEEAVKFLDYFYTEEGKLASNRGYEGVKFDFIHDDKFDFENPQMRYVRRSCGYSA